MDELKVLRWLKRVRGGSPFTEGQGAEQYLAGVKKRIKLYYGLDVHDWTALQVLQFIDGKAEENKL